MQDRKEADAPKWNHQMVALLLAVLVQFGYVVWFASSLNERVTKVEGAEITLQQRYEREVIPRVDLTQRLDRIDSSLDRIMEQLMEPRASARH
jgi:hypothetical protein